jgi:hypothetical protein
MAFSLAELFIDLKARDAGLNSQLDSVRNQIGVMGVAIGSAIGNLASSAIRSGISAVGGFFSGGIKGAVELQDQLSAIGVIFGQSAGVISGEADRMARDFGTVKTEFIGSAQTFGQMFKGAGKSQEDAAKLGVSLTKLALDMKSFKGGATTNQEVITALAAAMRGEFDPLERFGVMLNAAAVTQEALSSGLIKNAKDMDAATKVQATYNLIMKKTTDQQGDLARTQDQTGNSWTKITGTLTNLANDMGGVLMPAINSLLQVGAGMVSSLAAGFETSKESFAAFAAGVVDVVNTISVAWRNLPDLWEIVKLSALEMGTNILEIAATIPANLGIVGEWIANNWVNMIVDAFNAIGTAFKNLGTNLRNLWDAVLNYFKTGEFNFNWTPILEGFKATTAALPELVKPNLTSMQGEIDAVSQRIADREAARAAAAADQVKAKAAPAAAVTEAARKKEEKFKSETIGVADFTGKLSEGIFSGADKIAQDQLAEQKKTREATEQIAENTGKPTKVALA